MRVRVGLMIGLIAVLAAACYTPYDFDGSNKTNLVWWNYTTHQWQQYDPSNPSTPQVLATGRTDISEGWAGDYDGDGRYDLGILEQPSTWLPTQIVWPGGAVPLGLPTGTPTTRQGVACSCFSFHPEPVFGAYDGGHKTLPAFYNAYDATWTIRGHEPFTFGHGSHDGGLPDWDVPVPADYDGDGTTDVAVYNPVNGEWTVRRDGQPVVIATFGGQGALPLAADWDGDGDADPAYVTSTEIHVFDGPTIAVPAGVLDIGAPMIGDYDGDGRIEPGGFGSDQGPGDNKVWVTTVHDGSGPNAPLRIDKRLSIGNSTPAPTMSVVALVVDIARLTYLQRCLGPSHMC
jgi:hypothetical protein